MKTNKAWRDNLDEFLSGAFNELEDREFVVGPVVFHFAGNKKSWYFILASNSEERGFNVLSIQGGEKSLTEKMRVAAMLFFAGKGACVVHECDDELHMARLCNTLWPCPRTAQILAGIELERRT